MAIKDLYPSIAPSLSLDFANTKALDSRITFARASTGAYYDGKTVAKAEENLLLRSQEFNTAWANTNISVTANDTTAPDGTLTADKIVATANGGNLYQGITTTTNIGNNNQIVNLTDGTLGTLISGSFDSITTTLVANGFYRINIIKSGFAFSVFAKAAEWDFIQVQLLFTSNTIRFYIYPAETSSSTGTADSTSGIYVWGAQAEIRSSVTAYTPTTTQPITNYIPVLQTAPANTARFDHNPVTGESLGLLVEEQRVNLLTYSEQFDNAAWPKLNATVESNVFVSPDGALTGDKIVFGSAVGVNAATVHQDVTVSASTTYTYSIYLKAAGQNSFKINFNIRNTIGSTFAGAIGLIVNLTDGTYTTTSDGTPPTNPSYKVEPVGNGVYRCSISATMLSTTTIFRAQLTNSVIGDGYSGIYIWGAQLEAGAFPTSYIKTEASQVTRAADAASMTGANFSSWYRQDEGTVYVDGTGRTNGVFLNISDNSFNNRLPQMSIDGANNLVVNIIRNGSVVASMIPSGTHIFGTAAKLSMAYKTNDCVAVANSVRSAVVTSVSLPSGLTQMDIGSFQNGGSKLNGTIRKLAYYPQRLTDTQLQALTS